MSSIEELRKKLYGKSPFSREEKSEEPLRGYRYKPGAEPKKFWRGEAFRMLAPKGKNGKRGRLLYQLFIFSVVLFLGIAVYIGYELFLAGDVVKLQIVGPEGVPAGEPQQFVVFLKNNGKVGLRDVELNITYPENTIPVAATGEEKQGTREKVVFPVVSPGEEVKHDIYVVFLGKAGEERTLSALAVYRPENIQSRLTESTKYPVAINRSPFVITVEAPEEISAGQDTAITFTVHSDAKFLLSDISFRVDYPEGFEFGSADPVPSVEKNIWTLGTLAAGDTKKITVHGVISGQPEESKAFHGVLGRFTPETKTWLVYLEETRGPTISSPFLFVRQDINGLRGGAVDGGTPLSVSVTYKNNLTQKVSNVVIRASVSEDLVDLKGLQVAGGAYNSAVHEIQWVPSSSPQLKELEPGETGVVSFQVPLRLSPPLRTLADKNFSAVFKASIDTNSPPDDLRGVKFRYEDVVSLKINTRLALASHIAYFDSPVPNTGPVPPRVGQETTYTVYWQLANQANDAVNIEVRAGLPPNVQWVGTVGDVPGNAVFNSASHELLWSIPRLAAGTGILRPQATLMFRVGLTPGANQAGTAAPLISPSQMRATDAFTSAPLAGQNEQLTTELSGDSTATQDQWRVVR